MDNHLESDLEKTTLADDESFTIKEKLKILEEAYVGKRSLSDILSAHNISERTFYKWKKHFIKE